MKKKQTCPKDWIKTNPPELEMKNKEAYKYLFLL